jgi:hypothetical protein
MVGDVDEFVDLISRTPLSIQYSIVNRANAIHSHASPAF